MHFVVPNWPGPARRNGLARPGPARQKVSRNTPLVCTFYLISTEFEISRFYSICDVPFDFFRPISGSESKNSKKVDLHEFVRA